MYLAPPARTRSSPAMATLSSGLTQERCTIMHISLVVQSHWSLLRHFGSCLSEIRHGDFRPKVAAGLVEAAADQGTGWRSAATHEPSGCRGARTGRTEVNLSVDNSCLALTRADSLSSDPPNLGGYHGGLSASLPRIGADRIFGL